ncbi:bifunctional glutamate N-acetyltransferase/amino-acid acetyltransferase ArgJ [Acetobacter thailandicus]|uniref:Arginine biosynthesis bifunctional protein ArgJ n=1 Tax=Acetobacter thailandicus TaxID=1502842 RepID=A0ABT3QE96_9PROT|nr:bifunctional glutamate N-acetyltransferase/amino-acid acetyltransferase ArgJ [Acetobacter thailandicus]MCX2563605.1 bifunctional glutamate N-acetyltransferase/amino-acid acetyltransferase ArgJ [Acetobacter thailandicus]NHN94357.1 bifunctional glutamate N-acetyltransferase/amino-acid acetyltransferase ArgJ [Acetobacter thailandicus]
MAPALPVSPLARPLPELGSIRGVRLGAAAAGIRYQNRTDLVLAEFIAGTTVAGVFTKSKCPGAPVDWCRDILPDGEARVLVVNAGNANVFTGKAGRETCTVTADAAAQLAGCSPRNVYLASTGVIGEILPHERITAALPALHASLSETGWEAAARGIMTTDTFPKAAIRTATLNGATVTLQGIAKGSGMIAPDMATMLGFITTDAAIPAPVLQRLLSEEIKTTFNCITVDSDTSTSDMALLFATGTAENAAIDENTTTDAPILGAFKAALHSVLKELALLVIRDGEGVTKLITIQVSGAVSDDSAWRVAMAIGNSPLVKTAIAGEDANWGRVVMAVGKCGEPADRDTLSVSIGGVCIAHNGTVVAGYDETPVVNHMKGQEIEIEVSLGLGNGSARIWSCDLTHGYIDINGSYRS